MRHGDERESALWGRGKGEARASALWGRRGGRAALVVAAIVFAFPAAAIGGNGNGNSGNSGKGGGAPDAAVVAAGTTYTATMPRELYQTITSNPNQNQKVLVVARSGFDVNGAVNAAGGKVKQQFRSINGVLAQMKGDEILALAKNPGILTITRNDSLTSFGSDAPAPSTYVNEEVWRGSVGALPFIYGMGAFAGLQPPTIAIVDSGIDDQSVPDFAGRVITHASFVDGSSELDPEGHGTMVAGIAAGASTKYSGVAPKAKLVDVQVANADGEARTSDVIAGIDWILQHKDELGIRVVNISLSGNVETDFRYDPLDQAVEKLWLNGIVVVVPVGNQGADSGPVKLGSPANDPFVVTVGALDPNQTMSPADDFRAPWSAYGVTPDGFTKPELSAPGRYMVAPVPASSKFAAKAPDRIVAPGYMWMSGTSFSSPVVAGIAAQLLAAHPNWTPDQVKGALMASASRLSAPGVGVGEPNAYYAATLSTPPNVNEGLSAFVELDSTTGLNVFNAANWTSAVTANANWTVSNWTSANWTMANWTSANWTSANWTTANWTSANWTAANWVN
jgi:serine protease AprX